MAAVWPRSVTRRRCDWLRRAEQEGKPPEPDEHGLRLGKPGKLKHSHLRTEFDRWMSEKVDDRTPCEEKGGDCGRTFMTSVSRDVNGEWPTRVSKVRSSFAISKPFLDKSSVGCFEVNSF